MARGGFPGMPGGNMQQMLKQAQRMQANIAKLQEELEAREYEASAGGGMVNVRANGEKELLSIEIKRRGGRSRRCGNASGSGAGGGQRGAAQGGRDFFGRNEQDSPAG